MTTNKGLTVHMHGQAFIGYILKRHYLKMLN